jgi:hypothetical protein
VLAAKVEEHAEELVEILLNAARGGESRVVGLMLDRVFGRAKETVEHTQPEPEALRLIREMSDEELEAALRRTAPPGSPSRN